MLVRAERHYGDELAEVHLIEIDAKTVDELQTFIETGQCNSGIMDKLITMAPRVVPLMSADESLANAELRECICTVYVIETGHPIEISAKFRQQLK